MIRDLPAAGMRVRRMRLTRAGDFAHAAERIAEIAQEEGFVVAGAYPQSEAAAAVADAATAFPPAMCIELDAPSLTSALLRERPDAAVLLPWRVHLLQSDEGLMATTLDPTLLHDWIERPSAGLYKRISWLEVALEIVLEALA